MGEIFEYAIDKNSGAYQVYLEVDESKNQIDVYINEDFMYYNYVLKLLQSIANNTSVSEGFKQRVINRVRQHYCLNEYNEMFEVSICLGNMLVAVVDGRNIVTDHLELMDYIWDILQRFDFDTYRVTDDVRYVIEKLQRGEMDMI